MTSFSAEEIAELLEIQKRYGGLRFNDSWDKIFEMTKHLPVVQREQYRLFCAFCLYKIGIQNQRVRSQEKLPEQILYYHKRLLEGIEDLSSFQVRERWAEFGTETFVHGLEMVAQGIPELNKIVSFIKSKPTGKDFLRLIEEDRQKDYIEMNPAFLHFLPQVPFGCKNLITDAEYEQVRLQQSK